MAEDISRMIFKGGILGGACHFWEDPYLNSTTVQYAVLFDDHLLGLY